MRPALSDDSGPGSDRPRSPSPDPPQGSYPSSIGTDRGPIRSECPLVGCVLLQDLEFRQLIERLKLRCPIETIVGERVGDLKKKGALYQARCPFHEERTPSFTVDPRRGTWHCWGACSEGGDVISFLERFDGVSFLDAVRLLAQTAGEDLPETLFRKRSRARDEREVNCLDVLKRAEGLYARNLESPSDDGARAARDYALSRGLTQETLTKFGVGWSPRDGNPLHAAARRSGVTDELLIETGLVKRSDEGRVYDFFRGRLMVPIHDRLGRTIGFGARVLPQDEIRADGRPQAKYVNTPETPLFHKGSLIYASHHAASAVRRNKHLVLVEGYTDVMAAHQAGHENVAAVLGTATTDDHAALVRRLGARRVTLVFDGDQAGRNASQRALVGLLPTGVELFVATLDGGVDPCELILGDNGSERFAELLDGAADWFAWALHGLSGLGGAALANGVDELFELLIRIPKAVERSARIAELSRSLGLPEGDVRLQWREFEASHSNRSRPRRPESRPATASDDSDGVKDEYDALDEAALAAHAPDESDPELERVFESLLGALLLDNSLIPMYGELVAQCPEGDLAGVFRLMLSMYDNADDDQPIDGGRLLSALGEHPLRSRIALLEDHASAAESPLVLARDQELWLERRKHEHELEQMKRAFHSTDHAFDGDTAAKADVLRNLYEELRRRRVPERPTQDSTTA